MLSPYKLYKYDKALGHAVDPAGKALCTRHYNVDFTVHRLTPAFIYRRNARIQKGAGRILANISQRTRDGKLKNAPPKFRADPAKVLADTSPRWGEKGMFATGTTVALPPKGTVEVSKKTKGIAGVAGGGVASYTNRDLLESRFNAAVGYSHPKYKSKIKRATYTQYKY